MFVKPLSKRIDLRINELAETAYFTIKFIDRFGIDDTIGLEGEKPLVFMIPNNGRVERAPDDLLDEWEANTNKMLDKFEKFPDSREADRITSNHLFKFLRRQYYRVRDTDLKSLVEDDNTIEALDAYTIIE